VYNRNDLDGIREALGKVEQATRPSKYTNPKALIGDKEA
jgi:hypothetical protein